jgi:outer membrane lipoprotein-sorting protein
MSDKVGEVKGNKPEMKHIENKVTICTTILWTILGWLFFPMPALPQQEQPSNATFKDEPAAHALYDKMIDTMRKAETLSYVSEYRWEAKGKELGHCTYMIWLKKPNYFRLETFTGGILIGDGEYLWIYWPYGRPRFSIEDEDTYQKTNPNVYMKERTPIGMHSIAHKTSLLAAGMSMTIIDPSTFHGYTDSLQPYMDGVRSMGAEKIGDQECDVIEVSFMKHQRSWYFWLSKRDHLPRKLKQMVRVSYDIITHELWSNVTVNAEISMEKFAWKPPEGWKEWRLPSKEEGLLKPGQEAPNFDLASTDTTRIKLSDYRGKLIWLFIWRVG